MAKTVVLSNTTCLVSRQVNLIAPQLFVQQLAVNAQSPSRFAAIAAAVFQRAPDHRRLQPRDGAGKVGGGDVRGGRAARAQEIQLVSGDDWPLAEGGNPLHRIAQLAHIARPPIVQQTGRDRRGEA